MDEWIPIADFILLTNTSKYLFTYRVQTKQWYDGFVIKKKGRFWKYGNLEHYKKWKENVYCWEKNKFKNKK